MMKAHHNAKVSLLLVGGTAKSGRIYSPLFCRICLYIHTNTGRYGLLNFVYYDVIHRIGTFVYEWLYTIRICIKAISRIHVYLNKLYLAFARISPE